MIVACLSLLKSAVPVCSELFTCTRTHGARMQVLVHTTVQDTVVGSSLKLLSINEN
jgi:hypothetical protein